MRLYKFEITHVPAESQKYVTWANGVQEKVQDSTWKPEGWVEYLDLMASQGDQWAINAVNEGHRFFWPSTNEYYRTLETVRRKVKIVERWGGHARIFVADVGAFMPLEDAQRNDKIVKLETELRELKYPNGVPF